MAFPWEPKEIKDILYMDEPLAFDKELAQSIIDRFIASLQEKIKIEPADPERVFKLTQTYDARERKTKPHFLVSMNFDQVYPVHELKGKRSVIPEVERDTVTLTPQSLMTVMIIEDVAKQLLEYLPEAALCSNFKTGKARYEKMREYIPHFSQVWSDLHDVEHTVWRPLDAVYYVRDIKKCGLTYNNEFIHMLGKALDEKFPACGFQYTDAYTNIKIDVGNFNELPLDDDGYYHPKRGTILGMAAAMTTLAQIAIHRYILSEHYMMDVKALFYHDDSLFKGSKDHIADYLFADMMILRKLDIPLKDKSVAVLTGSVFCEEYTNQYDTKMSKHVWNAASLLRVLSTGSIIQAKEVVNSYSEIMHDNPHMNSVLAILFEIYGFEESPYEWSLPYLFGGWMTPSHNGWDESLLTLAGCPIRTLFKLYNMTRASVKLFGKSIDKLKKRVMVRRLPELQGGLGALIGKIPAWMPAAPVMFGRSDLVYQVLVDQYIKRERAQLQLSLLVRARKIAYRRFIEPGKGELDLFRKIIKRSPYKNYAIPEEYFSSWYDGDITEINREDYSLNIWLTGRHPAMVQRASLLKALYPDSLVVSERVQLCPSFRAMQLFYPEFPEKVITPPGGFIINESEMNYISQFVDPAIPFSYYYERYGKIPLHSKYFCIQRDVKYSTFWSFGTKFVPYHNSVVKPLFMENNVLKLWKLFVIRAFESLNTAEALLFIDEVYARCTAVNISLKKPVKRRESIEEPEETFEQDPALKALIDMIISGITTEHVRDRTEGYDNKIVLTIPKDFTKIVDESDYRQGVEKPKATEKKISQSEAEKLIALGEAEEYDEEKTPEYQAMILRRQEEERANEIASELALQERRRLELEEAARQYQLNQDQPEENFDLVLDSDEEDEVFDPFAGMI